MSLLTPKSLIERYFRTPHFNQGELIAYSSFPGSLMRAVVFMAACFSQRYRTKRRMEDYLSHVPRWYLLASKVFNAALFTHLALIVVLMSGLLIDSAFD